MFANIYLKPIKIVIANDNSVVLRFFMIWKDQRQKCEECKF